MVMPGRGGLVICVLHLALNVTVVTEQTSAPPPPRVAFVDVQGVRVQYLDWGGTGEPIVLVPGGCDTAYVFGDLAPLLTGRARVLGITPRGCGGSGIPIDDSGYGVDVQVRELIGVMDALGIVRATWAGHSSGGGKVIRLARQFPDRVRRLVMFDIVYAGVPDELEGALSRAIGSIVGAANSATLDAMRREFRAWELGAWSPALERNLLETTESRADGSVRYKPRPAGWQRAFVDDIKAGRYFETTMTHPALMFFAADLDLQRITQFSRATQDELRPLAEASSAARRAQIAAYQRNGSHVEVVVMPSSHYPFVDRSEEVASRLLKFVR
jgi:pimeloyl-ACP methyl ester carboxylesterase